MEPVRGRNHEASGYFRQHPDGYSPVDLGCISNYGRCRTAPDVAGHAGWELMDLAAQLRELRTRAGKPSIRTIELLVARQGRQHRMARSTIQDKLSGLSPLNLPQILSIIEALAEHARLNGVPLPQHEIDQSIWRERITSLTKTNDTAIPTGTLKRQPKADIDWDFHPLEQAQMYDLIEIIDAAHDGPVANWLPQVLDGMLQAGMTLTELLKRAAKDTPYNVVQTIAALEDEFPYMKAEWGNSLQYEASEKNRLTSGTLVKFAAIRHGITSSPVIVAGLRRAGIHPHVETYLSEAAICFTPQNIEKIVEHLRSSALPKDANGLLQAAGSQPPIDRTLMTLQHFQKKEKIEDRNQVLKGVAINSHYRIADVVTELEKMSAPEDMLLEIAREVPWGKHEEYAQNLEVKHERLANLIRRIEEDPWAV